MPKFLFTAQTSNQQHHSGELSADSLAEAQAELEAKGFIVHSLTQLSNETESTIAPVLSATPAGSNFESVRQFDQQLLESRIADFLNERDLIIPALQALVEELPAGSKRRRLAQLVAELQAGVTPEQLAAAEDAAETWLPLLSSASPFGSNRFLCDLFEETARTNAIRSEYWRISAYPTAIFFMAIAVVVFLSIVVVPSFQEIYNDFELDLPLLTLGVLQVSEAILFHPVLMLCLVVALFGLVYAGLKLIRRLQASNWTLGALSNGNSSQVATMAEFVRRVAEGLKTHLPLATSLRLAGQSCGVPWLRRESEMLASSLEEDGELGTPQRSGFPLTVVYALRASHDGGPNIRLLEEMATNYTERLETRFSWASGFLPILGIVIVGMAVFLVVMALYLPLVQLIDGLTG